MFERSPKVAAFVKYRAAFAAYAQSVRNLQTLTSQQHPDPAGIEAALLDTEKARLAYNRARDATALELLATSHHPDKLMKGSAQAAASVRVQRIAELLWELNGRPQGSAIDDWYRAESIVRQTAA